MTNETGLSAPPKAKKARFRKTPLDPDKQRECQTSETGSTVWHTRKP
jgi:hypothetical protein